MPCWGTPDRFGERHRFTLDYPATHFGRGALKASPLHASPAFSAPTLALPSHPKEFAKRFLLAAFIACPGATAALEATDFKPNPRFADLADGQAVDLGPYECEGRAPNLRCRTIFDFSRINYDPFNHRFVVFGGGHAATGRTDIDAFSMDTLTWRSLYPSMTCEQLAEGDIDPRGFHRKSGHPVARHTYDQNVIAEFDGQGWLLMFSTEGFPGDCHEYKASIQAPAAYPLTDPQPQWHFSDPMEMPWRYAGSAEFDPVSGHVVLLGSNSTRMWIYDPGKQAIVTSVRGFGPTKNSANLIYNPRDEHLYLIDRVTLHVSRIMLDRSNWKNTKAEAIATTGEKPQPMRNFAYDSRNHVIGGVVDGVFHALDMDTFEWRSYVMNAISSTGASIGTVHSHAIDYDPVNNVLLFVSGKPNQLHTWAYRFRE
jgi:hypothetical protein